MKDKITQKYISGFISSPVDIEKREINLLIKKDCECERCGKSIFELDDFPNIDLKKKEVLCEDCHKYEYLITCPICEDYFEKATTAKDQLLIFSKEAVNEYIKGLKPGFYRVKKWPFYYGNIVSGFESIFHDAIELIREVDINSMLYKLQPHNGKEKIGADQCCNDCMEKYTGKIKLVNNYFDKSYGKKRIKFETEIIKQGK